MSGNTKTKAKTKTKTKTKTTMNTIAEEYFYNINPLAQRIGEDVAATKEAYEGLWNTLSLSERNQAIDETIIQPEVALKYTINNEYNKNNESRNYSFNDKKDTGSSDSCYPKLRIQTGMKYVIDDTGTTLRWRDEHSAPFSVMTRSQMNLNLFDSQEIDKKSLTSGNFIKTESPQRRYSNTISKNNFQRDDINKKKKDTNVNDEDNDFSNINDNANRDQNDDDNYKNYTLVNKLTNNRIIDKNDDIKDENDDDDDDEVTYKKFIDNNQSFIKIKNNIDKESVKDNDKLKDKEDYDDDECDDDKKFLVNDIKSQIIVKQKMKINLQQNIDKDKVVKLLNDDKSNSSNKNNVDDESTALLLDTPSSYNGYKSSSQLNNDDGIPKTGFEFLDNW